MDLIERHKNELNQLCKKHLVEELYVFGSIVSGEFRGESDIDLLVRFGQVDLIEYFDNYMDLKDSLESLFGREIDLVEIQTITNPILKRSIDRQKTLVYERKDPEMAL